MLHPRLRRKARYHRALSTPSFSQLASDAVETSKELLTLVRSIQRTVPSEEELSGGEAHLLNTLTEAVGYQQKLIKLYRELAESDLPSWL